MSEEIKCSDCDSIKINEGDGKCSACHGTGTGGLLDHIADSMNPFSDKKTECWKCHGTSICQTCGGSGVVSG